MLVHGTFKFTRGEEGDYSALYKGPFDVKFRNIGLLTRAGYIGFVDPASRDARRWVGVRGRTTTDLCKDRFGAASALLGSLCEDEAAPIEKALQEGWEATRREVRGRDQRLSPETAAAIYDVLIHHAKANVGDREHFVYAQSTDGSVIREWRFGGVLGWGGKFRNVHDKWYVDAYQENETAEVRLFIARTNLALLELFRATYAVGSSNLAPTA
jgi:hypothetical protein